MKGTRSLQWGTYRRRKKLGTRNEDEDFRAPVNIGTLSEDFGPYVHFRTFARVPAETHDNILPPQTGVSKRTNQCGSCTPRSEDGVDIITNAPVVILKNTSNDGRYRITLS